MPFVTPPTPPPPLPPATHPIYRSRVYVVECGEKVRTFNTRAVTVTVNTMSDIGKEHSTFSDSKGMKR